jgi:hypothetical protein
MMFSPTKMFSYGRKINEKWKKIKIITYTYIGKHQVFSSHQMSLAFLIMPEHLGHGQPLCTHCTFLASHLYRELRNLLKYFSCYH